MNNQNIEELRLRDFLSLAAGDVPDPSVKGGADSEGLQSLKKQLTLPSLPISWSDVQEKIGREISDELDTSVLELWAQGWAEYKALMDDAERSRKYPKAIVISKLAAHTIESTLHPYLEVFLGPKKIRKIPFTVTLTTTIEAVELELKKGQITAVRLGEVSWNGKIQVGSVTLVDRKLAELSLPGRTELKTPIPLLREEIDEGRGSREIRHAMRGAG